MNLDEARAHCLGKKGAGEDFPFDDTSLAFRVGGKIFALVAIDQKPLRINLKCDPEWALELRASYADVLPGYHMYKKHWNTVVLTPEIPRDLARKMIDHSWELIFKSLTKKEQAAIMEADA